MADRGSQEDLVVLGLDERERGIGHVLLVMPTCAHIKCMQLVKA